MYKRILVPYDGTQLSDRAVAEAIAFAKNVGSKLILLYVVPPAHVSVGGDHTSPAMREIESQHAEESRKVATAMLERVRQRVADAGVECDVEVRLDASPYEMIIATREDLGCDLIMMASHGRRGLQGLLLGSETVKVLTHCTAPVLVVR